MRESDRLRLIDRSPITCQELGNGSDGLFNAILMWEPISSIAWAGIIYTVFWLFR